jgi:hypothetical protein
MMVVRMSALRIAQLNPPKELSLVLIKTMKNPNDTISNQTHNLLACTAVPEPAAPLRAQMFCFLAQNMND